MNVRLLQNRSKCDHIKCVFWKKQTLVLYTNQKRISKNISEFDFKAVEMNKVQPLIKTMFIFSSETGM